MALDYTKKTSRSGVSFWNVLHLMLGIGDVVLFIITMIDTDKNRRLIPIICLVAAVMNGADVIYKIRNLPHGKKNLSGVVWSLFLTILLLGITFFTGVVLYT